MAPAGRVRLLSHLDIVIKQDSRAEGVEASRVQACAGLRFPTVVRGSASCFSVEPQRKGKEKVLGAVG